MLKKNFVYTLTILPRACRASTVYKNKTRAGATALCIRGPCSAYVYVTRVTRAAATIATNGYKRQCNYYYYPQALTSNPVASSGQWTQYPVTDTL